MDIRQNILNQCARNGAQVTPLREQVLEHFPRNLRDDASTDGERDEHPA